MQIRNDSLHQTCTLIRTCWKYKASKDFYVSCLLCRLACRAAKKSPHSCLSWASLWIECQERLRFFSSLSTVQCQVFLGHPHLNCPNVPKTYSSPELGRKNLHHPVSGFLAVFPTANHPGICWYTWEPILPGCGSFFCCCFRNRIFFTGQGC